MKKSMFFLCAVLFNAGIVMQVCGRQSNKRDGYPPVNLKVQKNQTGWAAMPSDMDSTSTYYRYVQQLRKFRGQMPNVYSDQQAMPGLLNGYGPYYRQSGRVK